MEGNKGVPCVLGVYENKRRGIIGVGNVLRSDDGIGPAVIKKLREYRLPPDVELYDAGLCMLPLLPEIFRLEKAIIIDAVQGGGSAGEIYRIDWRELAYGLPEYGFSLHNFGPVEALRVWSSVGLRDGNEPDGSDTGRRFPEITIIGVEPGNLDWSCQLSKALVDRMGDIIKLVFSELEIQVIGDA